MSQTLVFFSCRNVVIRVKMPKLFPASNDCLVMRHDDAELRMKITRTKFVLSDKIKDGQRTLENRCNCSLNGLLVSLFKFNVMIALHNITLLFCFLIYNLVGWIFMTDRAFFFSWNIFSSLSLPFWGIIFFLIHIFLSSFVI